MSDGLHVGKLRSRDPPWQPDAGHRDHQWMHSHGGSWNLAWLENMYARLWISGNSDLYSQRKPRRFVHALAKGLSATLHPPQLRVFSGSGTRLCLTCVEQTAMIRQDRSYGWLSGTDGLVKKDEKATKTKYKNKFMWSIKNQLIRPKFLPKTLAFHRLEHHYFPCCHSNDRLVDFHHHTLNLPVMPVK